MKELDIPKGWKKVKLGDCIKEVVEKTTKNNQYEVLSVTKDGIFSQKEFFKKQIASENNIGYKIIRKNNLVFSTMNLWMGSLDVLTKYDIGIVSPAYKIFEFNEKLMLAQYGNYYMKSYYMLEQYKNCSEQGASIVRRNLDLKALLNIKINIPPIEEQEKIVGILNDINEIIIKNREKISLYIKRKVIIVDSILKNSKYRRKKVKEIAEIYLGLTHKPKYVEDGIPFLSSQNISSGYLDFDNIKYISQEEFDKASNTIKPKIGDVLFSRVGSNLGNPVIVDVDVNFGIYVSLGYLRAKKNVDNRFLKQWISSKEFSNQIRTKVSGGAKNNINTGWLKEFNITIPEFDEQKKLVRILENIDKENIKLKEKIEQYETLKKGLMQKLLTGKIRVKI